MVAVRHESKPILTLYPKAGGTGNDCERRGTTAHPPLLSPTCAACGHPFATVSPKARFCSTRCRTAAWKAERKQAALVAALADFFEVADSARCILAAAVAAAAARFYQFAAWLGLVVKAG